MTQEMTSATKRETSRANQGEATRSGTVYTPAADIYETEDMVVVVADLPGVAANDLDVSLERRVLTIRGHVPPERHEGYALLHAEYGEGDYERVFTLSEEIDEKGIEASHSNGVLTLKMPKAEAARSRKIEVRAS
jgi:HSP20 family protein